MMLSGTIVADATTVIPDGAVAVEGKRIEAVGPRDTIRDQYPALSERTFDVVAPGLVAGHVHTVQSLGRGIADDSPLLEWLFDYVLPMEAALGPREMEVAATLGYLELLESGVTTCIDHLSVNHADRAIEAAGGCGIRARLGKVLMDTNAPAGLLEDTESALEESEHLLRRYHGSFDDRIRYAVTPRFALTCSESCLRGCRELADRYDDVLIHTHANETRAEVETIRETQGMENVEWLHEVGLTGDDVVLAHGVWTSPRERDIIDETDTAVVHCPSANMKLASGVAPIVEYRDRDVTVALGNDGPPCNNTLDPFTEMRQAVLLQKVDRLDPVALTARDAFEMATVDGAATAGFDQVGALRPGWRADVIGLTFNRSRSTPIHDPISHLVYATHGDDVTFSMVDGTVVVDDGEVTTADAVTIRAEASQIAQTLSLEAHRSGEQNEYDANE